MASRQKAALEGVRIDPAEAVAVTLELAKQISSGELPGAPQDAGTVELAENGQPVADVDRLDRASPAALADFLHALLITGGERPVPGALMLTIARARGEIDLAGFATLDELVAALRRFAPADTRQALAALYDRLAPPPVAEEPEQTLASATNDDPEPSMVPASAAGDSVVTSPTGPLGLASVPSQPLPPADYEPTVCEDARPTGGFSGGRVIAIAALLMLFFGAGWFATSTFYGRGGREDDPSPAARRESPPPVAVVPNTARAPVEVTPAALEAAYAPAFVPSGEAFYFQSGRAASGDAQSAGDRDTQLLRVVDEGSKSYHVRPSPDGAWLAFDSDRDGARGVYIGRVDGSDVRRVSGPGHAAMPSWSPDGRSLAFVKAEADRPGTWNVWRLDLSTNEMQQVTEFSRGLPWGASWFPDGRRIAYSHEDRLIVHDLATGERRTFQSPESGRLVRTPVVSPDGTRIAYQVYRDGVWLLDVRDGSARRLVDDPTAEELVWDPQGRRLAFHSRRGGGWSIFVMAAGT